MTVRNDLIDVELRFDQFPFSPLELSALTYMWHWRRCYDAKIYDRDLEGRDIAVFDNLFSTRFFKANSGVLSEIWRASKNMPILDFEEILYHAYLSDRQIKTEEMKVYSAYMRLYHASIRRVWLLAEKLANKYPTHGTVSKRYQIVKDTGITASAFNPFLNLIDSMTRNSIDSQYIACMLATMPDPSVRMGPTNPVAIADFYSEAIVPANYETVSPVVNKISGKDWMQFA